MSNLSPLLSSGEHTPHRTSPTKASEGSSLAGRVPRAPLSELPVANFVPRPASPGKSHTSPSKANKLLGSPASFPRATQSSSPGRTLASASASPFVHPAASAGISRPGSAGSASTSGSSTSGAVAEKRGSLFSAARIKATELADLPLEQSPEIDRKWQEEHPKAARSRKEHGRASRLSPAHKQVPSADISPRAGDLSTRFITPPVKSPQKCQSVVSEPPGATLAPPSLARKKDRVQAAEATSLLLDDDEDAIVGSPSPMKSRRAERNDSTRSKASSSSSANPSSRKTARSYSPPAWTVLTDAEIATAEATDAGIGALAPPAPSDDTWTASDVREDEKENVKPDPIVIQGRRKGTGGRLSLVATGSQAAEGIEMGDGTISTASDAAQQAQEKEEGLRQ